MYVIKHIPEDFVVDEVSGLDFKKQGRFFCYLLKKKDYSTLSALNIIANHNHLKLSDFSFAGNKDRRAITSQVISVKKKLNTLVFDNFSLDFLGCLDRPVSLGFLEGNNFKITIRNISKISEIKKEFINFFGEQRFSENNSDIGRAIVNGDLKLACSLLKLNVKDNNFVSALLSSFPKKTLSLFVHAFQSLLWNKAVSLFLDKNPVFDKDAILPILGFSSQDLDVFSKEVLKEESLTQRNFIIRSIPDLSSEGSSRNVWATAEKLSVSKLDDDEFFPVKKKVVLSFFLKKGSYATEFIRQNFGSE